MSTNPYQMRTLTPLWTGNIQKNSASIRETGIMGSLRWWFEAIIRGFGGYACDPTDTHTQCGNATSEKAHEYRCSACQLFGNTGWQRPFRIEISGLEPIPLFFVSSEQVYQAAGNWLWRMFGAESTGGSKQGRGQDVNFRFGVQSLWGKDAKVRIVVLRRNKDDIMDQLAFLLDFIQRWGGLGAKTQNGFGQVAFSDLDTESVKRGEVLIKQKTIANPTPCATEHLSICNFFSHIYQIGTTDIYQKNTRLIGSPGNFDYRNHFIPCAFDIRYKSRMKNPFTGQGKDFGMRPWFKQKYNASIANELFGNSLARKDADRAGGRIGVSHLFRKDENGHFYLKVWGYVPDNIGIKRKTVAEETERFIQAMFPTASKCDEFELNRSTEQ